MDEKRIPEGPLGEDIETYVVTFHGGGIRLRPGDTILMSGIETILRKIRRCPNGEIYGMVEYWDGGLLWTGLAPMPFPKLTEDQEKEVEKIRNQIPRRFWVLGDWAHKLGDRTTHLTRDGHRAGTIVFMVATRPFKAGSVIAMDDGSLSIGDDVMALIDGRISMTHASAER